MAVRVAASLMDKKQLSELKKLCALQRRKKRVAGRWRLAWPAGRKTDSSEAALIFHRVT